MKRAIAVLLLVVMMVGLVATPAFAHTQSHCESRWDLHRHWVGDVWHRKTSDGMFEDFWAHYTQKWNSKTNSYYYVYLHTVSKICLYS